MNEQAASPLVHHRLIVAGILAACALALSFADRYVPPAGKAIVNDFASAHAGTADIDAAVNALFQRYHIDARAVTTWRVTTPDKKLLRLEQRAFVPPGFLSVQFNHELNERVAAMGARVVGTERTKENTVTMHVLKDGVVIRSIAFVMRPENRQGKQPVHTLR